MKYAGYEWVLTDHHDQSHRAQVGERFQALTWRFGEIHQAKVFIEYEHASSFINEVHGHKLVDMRLEPGWTQEEAMQRCLDWIADFEAHGPPSPETEMARCFEEYPSLYKTRLDVLRQWWFADGGDGYEWLDGAILNCIKEDVHERGQSYLEEKLAELEDLRRQMWEALPEDARGDHPELRPEDPEPVERPLPDDGGPRDLQLRPRSRILRIPPDVRADWKASAIEAATQLATRATDPDTRHAGDTILRELG